MRRRTLMLSGEALLDALGLPENGTITDVKLCGTTHVVSITVQSNKYPDIPEGSTPPIMDSLGHWND